MFTEQEKLHIQAALDVYATMMAVQAVDPHPEVRRAILDKVELLEGCKVTLHCDGCGQDFELDAFAGHHVCRGCGCRLCDGCYDDNGPTCGAPRCQDWEKWERADYEYDRRKDR